jgi:hypothetical protein
MEVIMRSNITRRIMKMAVAIGLATVGVSATSGAIAQSTLERAPVIARLIGGREPPILEGAVQITRDRQQLRGYFLDGSRDRLR